MLYIVVYTVNLNLISIILYVVDCSTGGPFNTKGEGMIFFLAKLFFTSNKKTLYLFSPWSETNIFFPEMSQTIFFLGHV